MTSTFQRNIYFEAKVKLGNGKEYSVYRVLIFVLCDIYLDFVNRKTCLNFAKSRMLHVQRKCCCVRFQAKLYHCHFEFFSSCFFDAKLVWCSRALNNTHRV